MDPVANTGLLGAAIRAEESLRPACSTTRSPPHSPGGRWPFPLPPRGMPGIPRGYLLEAVKR